MIPIPGGYGADRSRRSADFNPHLESVKQFTAVLAKYGDGTNVSSMSNCGCSQAPAAIKSAPPTELLNSDGIMFQRNGKQIAFSPNTCSADGILATADKKATFRTPAYPG